MSKTGWQIVATILGGVLTILPAHADTFGSGSNAFTIEFVDIGNAGNADDRALDNTNDTPGDPTDDEYASPYGGVGYVYRMGVTEVPQDWITKATTLGLSDVTAGAWTGLQPAANMSWFEAAAFVNWLNTSTGHQAAYQLIRAPPFQPVTLTLWSSAEAWQLGGENRYRHKDAYYFLPSEDEWYKAAYHKNDGVTPNYWDYATGSNTIPIAVASGTATGTAVYAQTPGQSAPAAVDNNGGLSAYGTRGQHGNVEEWNESAYDGLNNEPLENRTLRDGLWGIGEAEERSSFRRARQPLGDGFAENPAIGFRVASAVPEPSCAMLMIGSGLMLLVQRRRCFRK
jgi:formylglycine-generating enzyme required for sulfatase activity